MTFYKINDLESVAFPGCLIVVCIQTSLLIFIPRNSSFAKGIRENLSREYVRERYYYLVAYDFYVAEINQ